MRLLAVKRKGALAIVAKSAVERPVFLMWFDLLDTVAAWLMILGVIIAGATGRLGVRSNVHINELVRTTSKLTVREDFVRVLSMPERVQESLEDGIHPSRGGLR